MMKMTILAPRRAGMTHDEFRTYLTEVHGPLVRSITEVAADIRHYHYNFPIVGATDTAFAHPIADLDVITQGYFDSREAQLLNMQHPRFMKYLRPDEANFADTARAVMHYTDEHEIRSGPTTSTKVFYLRRRAEHLGRAEFQERWVTEFPALLDTIPGLSAIVTRYVQNHVQAEEFHPHGTETKFYDVLDELWLTDLDSLHSIGSSPALGAIRELEAKLLDVDRTRAHIATLVESIP
jgi:EthD domain